MQPTNKLQVSATGSYTDNLAGVLYRSLLTSGSTSSSGSSSSSSSSGSILPTNSLDSSHAWDLNAAASYSLAANLWLQGQVDRREQAYLGEDFGATSYSAGVTYARGLFGGTFNTRSA